MDNSKIVVIGNSEVNKIDNAQAEERLLAIEKKILVLKQTVAYGLIEIGKNLIEAKTLVRHGEWGTWLETHVGFTVRTAQNYMKLARTFGDWDGVEAIADLEASKLFLLQEMSADTREAFLEVHDVRSMSVRELKTQIKNFASDYLSGKLLPNHTAILDANYSDVVESGYPDQSDKDKIWTIFDREFDPEIYTVPVNSLRKLPRYEEFFYTRKGEKYIRYLDMMSFWLEFNMEAVRLADTVLITRDMTVLDDYEIVRAYMDLGIETIYARYYCLPSESLVPGMTLDEYKIRESLILHSGMGELNEPQSVASSIVKFRREMLEKGIDLFKGVEEFLNIQPK